MQILLVLLCCATIGTVNADSRPNVLFLISDDLRVQLGYSAGSIQFPYKISPQMHTPHLDQLASRSAVFHRAYVQQALCNPSRTSALTGRRPDTTRVYSSKEIFRSSGGNFTTLPQLFKENGYLTLSIGKIFHPDDREEQLVTDELSWSEPAWEAPNHKYWKSRWHGSNKAVSPEERQHLPLPDEQVAEQAVQTLRAISGDARSGERPFFLAVGFHKPHLPFIYPSEMLNFYPEDSIRLPDNGYAPVDMPPVAWHKANGVFRYPDIATLGASPDYNTSHPLPAFKVKELRRAYYACVTYVDAMVGRVLEELEQQGLINNTIIVFWGDHGWHLGEHGAWSKQTNFEQATRAPLLITYPGMVESGPVIINKLVEMVDIFPTLAELALSTNLTTCSEESQDVPLCTEGRSLVPLISRQGEGPWKEAVFSQFPRLKDTVMGYSMKTDRFRYTEWSHVAEKKLEGVELYDHKYDPEENFNVINDPSYSRVVEKMVKKLSRGWRNVREV